MVDESYRIFANIGVSFSYYVDDVAIEVWGTLQFVSAYAPRATNFIVDFMEGPLELGVSETKSGVIASDTRIAKSVVAGNRQGKIKHFDAGKLLGVWGSGGRKRCTVGHKKRLAEASSRIPRVHHMRAMGVSALCLVRASFNPVMNYEVACTGWSTSHLHSVRVTTAKGLAPPGGGKNVDLVLYAADASGGRNDPAFDGHALPLRSWALAWTQTWRDPHALTDAFSSG
jgi:hypothetical protein